jgi:hypothetical protein
MPNELLDPRSIAVAVARTKNAKLAALYFDYVVPILCQDVPATLLPPSFGDWQPASPLGLLTKLQAHSSSKYVSTSIVDRSGRRTAIKLVTADGEPDIDALEFVNEWYFLENPGIQAKLRQEMHNAMIDRAPVVLSRETVDLTRSAETLGEVMVTLANMPLIDVDGAAWEQILDLRQDIDSRQKFRRLRRALVLQYVGKTREEIEASISATMEEYERAARKHGFKLVLGALRTMCDSKTLLASAGIGAIAGSLAGAAPGAAIGATVGISIELVKMALTVAEGVYDMRSLREGHDLAYIIEAQRRIGLP